MSVIKYLNTYGLTPLTKGASAKLLYFAFFQGVLSSFFFEFSDFFMFVINISLIGAIMGIFIYSYSAEQEGLSITMQYPLTEKRKILYDILATILFAAISIASVLIISFIIVLIVTSIKEGRIALGALTSTKIYGIIYNLLYMFLLLFLIQPLKYVKKGYIWYLLATALLILLTLYNMIISAIISGKYSLNYDLLSQIDNSEKGLSIILFTSGLLFIISILTTGISIKLSKK